LTTALLYFVTAAALVWLAHRTVVPISRAAAIVLVLLPLCFTGRALLTGRVYAPIDLAFQSDPLWSMRPQYGVKSFSNAMLSDVYCLNIPWKVVTREAYARGSWALWNHHPFAGDILAATAQPTPYEPVFLLSLLLPMANSLTYLAAMAFFLAGLCMFLYLRDLGCEELASLIGAAGWMYCGFLVFWLEWVITTSALWLPLVFLGVRRIVCRRDLGSMFLLVVAFVMMLQNGHPESALHIVALGIPYALFEMWPDRIRVREMMRAAGLGVAAGVVALLLSAIYLLPIIEAIPQTLEHWFRQEVYAHARKSYPLPEAMTRLSKQFVPFAFGYFQRERPKAPNRFVVPDSAYSGSVLLALAALGLWRGRRRERWFFLAIGVAGYLIGGQFPGPVDWLGKLPLFDIALNERLIFAAAFALAVLGAFGADDLLRGSLVMERHPEQREGSRGSDDDRVLHGILRVARDDARPDSGDRMRFAVVVALTGIALAIWTAAIWYPARATGLSRRFLMGEATSLLLPLLLIAVLTLISKNHRTIVIACLGLLLAQRTAEMGDFYPTNSARLFYPRIPLLDRLPRGGSPYRVVGARYAFVPNLATMYGLEDARGYTAMTFHPLSDTIDLWSVRQVIWFNRVDDLTRPFLSLLNVRYAIAAKNFVAPRGWHVMARDWTGQILENERALPRAFVPASVRVGVPAGEAFKEISAEADFARTAWISLEVIKPSEYENGPGTVDVREEANGLRLTAQMEAPGWVVISEAAWKGWRARLDGEPAVLVRADHAFLALFVPRGRHEIRLSYLPRSFVLGRAISGATLAILLTWAAISIAVRHRKRRRLA
jgi:Bacterial membrane protein YfhO